MFWYSLQQLIAFLLDSLRVVWQPLDQKDLEILFLRQQLAVVRRRQKRAPTLSRFEKLLFATLITQIKRAGRPVREQLGDFLLLFQPDTLYESSRSAPKRRYRHRGLCAGWSGYLRGERVRKRFSERRLCVLLSTSVQDTLGRQGDG